MNLLTSLNIYKNLNNGNLIIKKLSIFTILIIIIIERFLFNIIASSLLKVFISILPKGKYSGNISIFILEFFSAILTLSILCLFLGRFDKNNICTYKKISSGNFFYATLIIIGFRLFYAGSIAHLTNLMPIPKHITDAFDQLNSNYVYLLLSVCIFAPFIEEFLYRGIILSGLLKKYSPITSILLSSLIFAIVHMNLPQGINAFILGLFLSLIYYKTKNLYICIFIHFINNLCANFIIMFPINITVIIVQSIIFILLGIYIMYFAFKKFNIISSNII